MLQNTIQAKKLLTEKSAGYMSARTAFREMKIMLKVVDLAVQRNWVAVPPRFTDHDCAVVSWCFFFFLGFSSCSFVYWLDYA